MEKGNVYETGVGIDEPVKITQTDQKIKEMMGLSRGACKQL